MPLHPLHLLPTQNPGSSDANGWSHHSKALVPINDNVHNPHHNIGGGGGGGGGAQTMGQIMGQVRPHRRIKLNDSSVVSEIYAIYSITIMYCCYYYYH